MNKQCKHPCEEDACRRSKKERPRKPIKRQAYKISKVSDRQAKLNLLYSAHRKTYLKFHPICEAKIECSGAPTTDIHHRMGRGRYLLDSRTWLACCRKCHRTIEDNPELAKEEGLSESRHEKNYTRNK